MAQFARPNSNPTNSTWNTSPLDSKVDEGAPGDGTVITTATNANGKIAVFGTNSVTDPVSSTGYILRVRGAKSGASGANYQIAVELREAYVNESTQGTLRATLTHVYNDDILATDEYTLSTAEANSVSDHTDLFLRVVTTKSGGGGNQSVDVDFVELETEDAAAEAEETHARVHISQP